MESGGFIRWDVFQRAYKASLEIHHLSLRLPREEQYGLGDQLRRASKSIPANLAEGYARRASQAELNRFVQMAIGSADETRVWLRYCFDLGYLSKEEWCRLKSEYCEIGKMLAGLSKAARLNSDV